MQNWFAILFMTSCYILSKIAQWRLLEVQILRLILRVNEEISTGMCSEADALLYFSTDVLLSDCKFKILAWLRVTIVTFAKEFVFICACYLVGLCKKCKTDLHKIWWNGGIV